MTETTELSIKPNTLRPYDVHVCVAGSTMRFTASMAHNGTGADFLRALYKRAYTPESMSFNKKDDDRTVTVTTDATHLPTMHTLAELLAFCGKSVRLTGEVKQLYSTIPWKAVAYFIPNADPKTKVEKSPAGCFTIKPLDPYGLNKETFKYIRHLGGWKLRDGSTWVVSMNKLFKFIQSNQPGARGIAIDRSIATFLTEEIGAPFTGNIFSLKDIPVQALHFAQHDSRPQNSKREKGKTLAESLAGYGYATLFDVLYNMPRRYLDLSNPVTSLRGLDAGDTAHIVGKVQSWFRMQSGKGAYCSIKTAERTIKVQFWGNTAWREKKFPVGTEVIVGGKVSFYGGIGLSGDFMDTLDVSSADNPYVPIYSQSPSRGIMTTLVSNLVRESLTRLTTEGNTGISQNEYWAEETLPDSILPLNEALIKLHFPEKEADIRAATDSLAWYELVLAQVLLKKSAEENKLTVGVKNEGTKTSYVNQVLGALPYTLTGDQQEALKTIRALMSANTPMDALLSADVGAGKTIIQILAALQAVDSGRQAVIVAPTDILAQQIFKAATTALEGVTDLEPVYLSGSMSSAAKEVVLKGIETGEARFIIGTHTLLNAPKFYDLGLVCFDEQQKFGVEQRERLLSIRDDQKAPDFLVATATPIPRTIAQIAYGEVTFIKMSEKPAGRKPVETEWVEGKHDVVLHQKTHHMWKDIHHEIKAGHQIFIVAPLVEEREEQDAPSVKALKGAIAKLFPKARLATLHSKMKAKEQAETMRAFRDAETDILIASTIIEVGVDIPNATRIIIMGAERLGASSLHQLRGRVGRSDLHAKCWLVSPAETKSAQARMEALVNYDDGFAIAEADTETRGEGDILTSDQHGVVKNRFLRLGKHRHIIASAIEASERILTNEHHTQLALDDAKKLLTDNES